MGNRITNQQKVGTTAPVTVLPAPRVNLHDLESVRREMAKVYRDMRVGTISTQDGARLVYVLGEIRKMFEAVELEKRIAALEEMDDQRGTGNGDA